MVETCRPLGLGDQIFTIEKLGLNDWMTFEVLNC